MFRKNETVRIFDIDNCDAMPPSILFSVSITNNFNVTALNGVTPVPIRDLLGFSHRLTKWSQLDEIINRTRHAAPDVKTELDGLLAKLDMLLENSDELEQSHEFLLEQFRLSLLAPHGRRYSPQLTSYAVQLFLSSRHAYRVISDYLALPSPRTLYQHISRICDIGQESECEKTIASAMTTFSGLQKWCILLFDEMYIKPSIRYRGGHLLGQATDDSSEVARTILAIMIKPMMGAPAFVCRLIPIHKLSAEFLHRTLCEVIHVIHRNSGRVLGLMSDNHPTNRRCYSLFREGVEGDKWIGKNPADDTTLYLLNDPVHLLKSVRNNWVSEKLQLLTLVFEGQELVGKWKEVCAVFQNERDHIVRRTLLNYQACFPSNIDLQKMALFTCVFHEKTVCALREDGSHATAKLIEIFANLWKILNVKNSSAHIHLNDAQREPLSSVDDPRFAFLESMADAIAAMKGGKGVSRATSLTSETRDALANTLRGLVALWKGLLSNGFHYILSGTFQSDRLEGEFGIYR